jgi:hypothetical protein
MTFQWQVSEDGVVNQALVSTSRNPFKFILPSGVLTVGRSYTITVIVADTLFGGQAYSVVSVDIAPSAVVAVISGGAYQSWRVGETALTIDGSGSYDLDTVDSLAGHDLKYTWACDQNKSTISLADSFCEHLMPTSSPQNTEIILNMTFTDFNAIIGATFVVSLQIEGSYNRSDFAHVVVTVAESLAPKIDLLSFPPK